MQNPTEHIKTKKREKELKREDEKLKEEGKIGRKQSRKNIE